MRELLGNVIGFCVFGALGLLIAVWAVTDTHEVDQWLIRTRAEILGSR